jgi:hypothetical protein
MYAMEFPLFIPKVAILMKKGASRPTASSSQNLPKAVPLTFQGRVEKWFLPFLFVVIGVILVWTFVHAYLAK